MRGRPSKVHLRSRMSLRSIQATTKSPSSHHEPVRPGISGGPCRSRRSATPRCRGGSSLQQEMAMTDTKDRKANSLADNLADHSADDLTVDRRGALECMIWAGTGVLWTISG